MTPSDPAAAPPADDAERARLQNFVRDAPLAYGTWRDLKGLYKRLEADPHADAALLGALIGRLDQAAMGAGDPAARWQQPVLDLGERDNAVAGIAAGEQTLWVLGGARGDRIAAFRKSAADPLRPERFARASVRQGQQIVLCGGGPFVCVMNGGGYSGAGTLNVYDAGSLAHRGHVAVGGFARLAATADASFVYVLVQAQRAGFNGLRIADVSDPAHPRIAGELALTDASAVAASGALVAVVVGRTGFGWTRLPRPGGVRIVDVSDAARPRVVGSLDLGDAKSVALLGRFAFVGIGRSGQNAAGVQIVDLSDPARPRKAGFCPLPAEPAVLAARDNVVYAATQYSGLFVVDVSDPAAPVAVGKALNVSYPSGLAVTGQTLYAATQYNGLALFDLTKPDRPARIGAPPSADTLAYMKRRARRLLKNLSASDPARYVMLAAAALAESGRGANALDGRRHWVALDVLQGGSGRLVQKRHGRGAVVEARPGSRLRLRTREERAPHAWDARPDLAADLLTASDPLPWQTQEFALRVLRAADRAAPPNVPDATLEGWVESPSPLLIVAGARIVAERLVGGQSVHPRIAAGAFFHANAPLRRRIANSLNTAAARNESWAKGFAARLAPLVQRGISVENGRLTRRAFAAAVLLAEQFPGAVADHDLLPLLAALLATDHAELRAFVTASARRAAPQAAGDWLRALETAPAGAGRDAVLSALEDAVRHAAFDMAQARALVQNDPLAFVRENGWRLLAASRATTTETLAGVWEGLFAATAVTPALETAMASPHALGLLERAGIGPDELASRLAERPFLVGLLTPQAFTRVAQAAPGAAVLALVAAAPDELWERLRPAWLRNLREGVGLESVWLAVEAAIANDASGRIVHRVVDDPDIAQTFLGVDDEAVLSFREPALNTLLGRWARVHENRFPPRSPLLLGAAMHALPDVRAWALARSRETGLDLPFALRLLESGVPPSAALGRAFFEAAAPGDPSEFTFALALCDSPQAPVRAFGREYVSARWSTLPHAAVLRALFENPEPDMQTFVAEKLGQSDDAPRAEETAAFDRDVLKTTNRARRAKEQVKARQTAQPTLDTNTLLALARRGDTPRDADWALAELARRALAGETIEGVTVDGVAGI